MMKLFARWFRLLGLVAVLGLALHASGESVATLPAPTGYVNDFAHVLSPEVQSRVDRLCAEVDRQAHAQIAVVTINTLDGDQSIEEFATALEDKWKVGPKGSDRGVLMILVMHPRRGRIEVGYGLEGVLNDAKVGDIGRSMVPDAQRGDYNAAVPLGVGQIADDIAKDAGVTLTPTTRTQPQQVQQPAATPISPLRLLVSGAVLLLILFLIFRGGAGPVLWMILGNFLGGGFGGGRGRRGGGGFGGGGFGDGGGFGGGGGDDGGGGFGGFGGGSSGGGGASGDF